MRGYLPLDPGHSLVLASRLVVDLVAGDLPITELDRVGGTLDYGAFGGHRMGRGILEYRYLGRIRVQGGRLLRSGAVLGVSPAARRSRRRPAGR